MKIKIELLLLLTILSFHCWSQFNPVNARFKGGETEFHSFMNKHLKYPPKSCNNNVIGYSITGITITPNGDVAEVFTVNPLDQDIDQHMTTLLSKTKGCWLKSDTLTTNQTFYCPGYFPDPEFW